MKKREVVRGAKDFLPDEAGRKREIENSAVDVFQRWGYREVVTPTFEYLEVIEAGAGTNMRDELFLMQDRDGRLLALRPEMTIPLARVASTRMADDLTPLRLFYSANIFGHTETQIGRYKEFYQLGVELIGTAGARADAEVIALAAEILNRQELSFQISLNHIGIFHALIENSGLTELQKEQVMRLTLHKDLVGLEQLLAGLPIKDEYREAFMALPVTRGGIEAFSKIRSMVALPDVARAVEELTAVYNLIGQYGIKDQVSIDLGILRGFDYYTGIIFEGYSPNLGYPLLGGGRYDRLLEKFGKPMPATGFAVGVERILLCLQGESPKPKQQRLIVRGDDLAAVLDKARDLRFQGHIAEVDLSGEPVGTPVQIREVE